MHAQLVAAAEPLRQDITSVGPVIAAIIGTYVVLLLLGLANRALKIDQKFDDVLWAAAAIVGIVGALANFGLIQLFGSAVTGAIRNVVAKESPERADLIYALIMAAVVAYLGYRFVQSRNDERKSALGPVVLLAIALSTFFASGTGQMIYNWYVNKIGINAFNWSISAYQLLESFGK